MFPQLYFLSGVWFRFLWHLVTSAVQRAMKSRRDDASKQAAEVAEQAAAKAMEYAEEAVRRAEMQGEDGQDDGPAKCFAIFKAEGFGMLEAMSQVRKFIALSYR